MTKPNGESTWKVIDLIVRVCVAIMLPAAGFILSHVMDLETRMTAVEANRFTSRDGIELREMIQKKFDLLRSDITEIKTSMPREVPPTWFLERVTRIEKRVDGLDAKVEAINNK